MQYFLTFFTLSKSAQPFHKFFREMELGKMAPITTPISVDFFALASLVAHHCAKTETFLKGLTQTHQKALQYLLDMGGSLMNLKKFDLI